MIPGYLFINISNASNVLISKKLVGSSKINIFAFVENNTANDNFVLSPPLKTLQERSSASFKPKLFKIALLNDSMNPFHPLNIAIMKRHACLHKQVDDSMPFAL